MISSPFAKYRLPYAWLLLAACIGGSAHAASFDCKKAASAVEKAICGDDRLSGLDEQVHESYGRVMDSAPSANMPALRDDQRGWLKQRNQCAPTELDCLADAMAQRVRALGVAAAEENAALDRIIASIPTDPAAAARALRGYAGPLPSAWLVYLHAFEPKAGVTVDEARQRRAAALAGLDGDSYTRELYLDTESKKYSQDDNAPLTLLRMLIERAGYEDYNHARPYVHCFVFARQGEAAYRAFGSLYGSSRDAQAPVCSPQDGLFDLSVWKHLEKAIDPAVQRASNETGTIRYSYYTRWSIQELRATMSPRDFLKPLPGDESAEVEKDIRAWQDEASWPAKERDAVLALVAPAKRATADWLKTRRGFNDADAAKGADGIVRAWLAERTDFIGGNH